MRHQISKRDRWAALGILLSVVMLVYFVCIHPWFTQPLIHVEGEIESLRQRELRMRMLLAQAPEVTKRLARAQAQLSSQSGFLAEPSAELASVGLVERLEHTVSQVSPNNRSCTIANRSPLQPERVDRFVRVAIQVRLRCGTPELAEILYSLENTSPSLYVDNLNIMAQRYQLSPNETGNGLDVAFELAGYLRPKQEPSTTGASSAAAPFGQEPPASQSPSSQDTVSPSDSDEDDSDAG